MIRKHQIDTVECISFLWFDVDTLVSMVLWTIWVNRTKYQDSAIKCNAIEENSNVARKNLIIH